ncbi:hypothetical protein ACT3SP_08290 [Brachybacterium sp. AOP43-C2-M15]|uniref:hypothetical protein n=1 Tax=Brachybacterium sp. AOP43-C2-M15 TaxID=3457661 RepID=UPI0040345AEF
MWTSPWRHLPSLAAAGAATALTLATALWITGGIRVPTPLLAALLCGPTLLPLFSVVQDALVHDDTELRLYARALRGSALRGTAHALTVGLCLSALLAALEVHARTGSDAVVVSLALAASGSVLTAVGLLALLPLAVARPGLRGVRLWITAWHLLGRWPVRFLAPAVVCVLAAWAGTALHSSLILLLPVPVALMAGAAYWCCALDLGAEDLSSDAG